MTNAPKNISHIRATVVLLSYVIVLVELILALWANKPVLKMNVSQVAYLYKKLLSKNDENSR